MRNKILFSLAILLASIAVFSAFKVDQETKTESDFLGRGTGPYYIKEGSGTISGAGNDTISIPTSFSLYTLGVQATRTNVSGTTNVKVYLDGSAFASGTTNWRLLDSVSTTTATQGAISTNDAIWRRYRVRFDGTGTQSTTYTYAINMKQKN